MLQRCYNFAEWWHLLTLDAPTIAVLWSWAFARAVHLHLPLVSIVPLALVTWLLYVTDHLLDGIRLQGTHSLRERHIFCARHRRGFLVTAFVFAALTPTIFLTRIYPTALRCDLVLAVFVCFYFLLVHAFRGDPERGQHSWLPKELAVGILFAAATAVPAWSRLNEHAHSPKNQLAQAAALFALLCWVNCVAIEKWETSSRPQTEVHASTRWVSTHLQQVAAAAAFFSLCGICLAPTHGLASLYLAALISSCFLLALDARRSRFSALSLRIAADAALLTPLALFPIFR